MPRPQAPTINSLAKTLADCLKYRNRIRANLAQQALDECIVQRKCSLERLRHFAKICRVRKLIQAAYSLVGGPTAVKKLVASRQIVVCEVQVAGHEISKSELAVGTKRRKEYDSKLYGSR
jgi:hypothetical protein